MTIAAIVARIVEESTAEASAILHEADTRAASLVQGARDELRMRVQAALERGEPARQAEGIRRVNAARMRSLEQRATGIARRTDLAFAEAAGELDRIATGADPERWAVALRRLVDEALSHVGDRAVVRVRAADAAAIAETVAGAGARLELAAATELAPGVVVRSADGRLEVDATVPARLERARSRLAERVARALGVAG
jgi:vacuolar-type H+-ATPase subunit E/Vma4